MSARRVLGAAIAKNEGYGPLVNKGDLWLPIDFNYQIISVQGTIMSDGQPTPGILPRNGRLSWSRSMQVLNTAIMRTAERSGSKSFDAVTSQYNEAALGGNTEAQVCCKRAGQNQRPVNHSTHMNGERFAILGGISTDCAGGIRSPHTWITCEEVVKNLNGKKHGYIFEIDTYTDGPVPAIPVVQAGPEQTRSRSRSSRNHLHDQDRSITSYHLLGSNRIVLLLLVEIRE